MGLLACPVHGERILAFVSAGIAEAVRSDKSPTEEVKTLTLEVEAGVLSHHIVDRGFCEQNQVMLTLVDQSARRATPGEASFELFCQLVGVCEGCLVDWLKRRPSTEAER
jgi:hypothetical protein